MKPSKYIPISCDFYDELEALAIQRKNTTIVYREPGRELRTIEGRIADLQTENKVEFMILADGQRIRLDWLQSVDGKVVPKTC